MALKEWDSLAVEDREGLTWEIAVRHIVAVRYPSNPKGTTVIYLTGGITVEPIRPEDVRAELALTQEELT